MRRVFAALALVAALGAGFGAATVVAPAGGVTGASCSEAQRAASRAALAAFTHSLAARQRAFNRTHKRPKDRAAFARKQRATLNRLRAAAACTLQTTAAMTTTLATTTVATTTTAPTTTAPPITTVPTTGNACAPTLDPAGNPTNGTGTLRDAGVRGLGTLHAVMLFVDFPDAPSTETTTSLYDILAPESVRSFSSQSFGRLALQIDAVPRWYRMLRNSGDYGLSRAAGTRFEQHRAYMQEAVSHADADVDFRGYQIVYIVSTSNAKAIDFSPAFVANRDSGGTWALKADGALIYAGATFGTDIHSKHILEHETGHAFGLPDYNDNRGGITDWYQLFHFAGAWSIMSTGEPVGGEFFAWDKYREGWIDPAQVRCQDEPGSTTQTLTPVETRGGLKMIVAKTGPSTAYVAEVRSLTGGDANLCSSGVLVYALDARVFSGAGPLQVETPHPGADPAKVARCNTLYDAPLRPGESWGNATVQIEVLSAGPDGSFNVRVTRK
jgi:M6 family metalloprotease-like protein